MYIRIVVCVDKLINRSFTVINLARRSNNFESEINIPINSLSDIEIPTAPRNTDIVYFVTDIS